jgi:ATP-dependent helicase/DNAse subunit B
VIVDYKSGAAPHPVEDMRAGRDFQMMIYLLAAEAELAAIAPGVRVAGGLFWHTGNQKISGEVTGDDAALDDARGHLHAHVLAARDGLFLVRPRKGDLSPCGPCDFRRICRVSRASLRKPVE